MIPKNLNKENNDNHFYAMNIIEKGTYEFQGKT